MNACQNAPCGCGCHVPLTQRLEAVGLSLDSMTPTELALVDALLPPDEWRDTEWLCAAAGFRVGDTRHSLRTNLCRLRPKLHATGWDVVVAYGTGRYRVQRCTASGACPSASRQVVLPTVCIHCGELRVPRRFNKAGRCARCLERWRAARSMHAGVPRCTACGELLHMQGLTLCKSCRLLTTRLCADCATPISQNAERCLPCAMQRRRSKQTREAVPA